MTDETTTNIENLDITTEGTVRHNKALLDELKQARTKLADFERQQEEREIEVSKKKGDYESLLKKEQEKAAKLLNEREEALSARDQRINSLLTDNALSGILALHDVRPELSKALTAYLRTQMTITDDGVVFGDKPADVFAKEFFGSDEGKSFLKPVINTGGGATGNTGTQPGTPDEWNLTLYMDIKKEDPAMAAAYAKKHSKKF